MLTDIYLHAAAVAFVVAGFIVALVAGFVALGLALGGLAYLRARAELRATPAAPEAPETKR